MTPTLRLAEKNRTPMTTVILTSLERALLRLLATGHSREYAAQSVGLSPAEAESVLLALQNRCGVSGTTRLLAVAILRSWV